MPEPAQRDLVARPLSFLWAWGLPTAILIGASMSEDEVPPIAHVAAISGAFLWMGIACLINAKRCRRLHCFISGPVFLIGALAVALIGNGVLVLLYVEFQSIRLMALIAISLPFALVGGVAGVFVTGGTLSLGSLVGFVTVLGIAARNGIMLISHYRHLETHEGMTFGPELVLRGAQERLAPILMTAPCASLALLPIVAAANAPGHEIEAPMAAVILGGLVTSTILTLALLPSMYLAFGKSAADVTDVSERSPVGA